MQKIVPLSFSLPRPEAFTPRRHFNEDALQIYCDVHGTGLDAKTAATLTRPADVYGEALATPRDVIQAVSAVRFRSPDMKDYVWFPELCLLQLIRVTNPSLYDCAEHYLSERAIEKTGDASQADKEKQNL